MRNNKKRDWTPFNMGRTPVKQYPILMPLIWGASYVMTRQFPLKIHKKNMSGVKPPYLVFSTHQGFSDYFIAPLALFPHRANYVSDMEGFAAFGEWLYRGIGCIGKRRYVPDIAVVQNIKTALNRKQSVVVFPESRHSNVGTTAYLPPNLGKLAKLMNVSVVTLSVHGSYLANPFWDESHTRKVPIEATLECIYTLEELQQTDEAVIQNKIENQLQYNEYLWQQEHQIRVAVPRRAEGLDHVLYQCMKCGKAFQMNTSGSTLQCKSCGAAWELNELGKLIKDQEVCQISDWYEWERSEVEQEIRRNSYICDVQVHVDALPNAKGFISLGDGHLKADEKGFYLMVAGKRLFFDHRSRESVQTEYNYRERGACIVLSNQNCCYYIYGQDYTFNPTQIQFAGEYYHQKIRKQAL